MAAMSSSKPKRYQKGDTIEFTVKGEIAEVDSYDNDLIYIIGKTYTQYRLSRPEIQNVVVTPAPPKDDYKVGTLLKKIYEPNGKYGQNHERFDMYQKIETGEWRHIADQKGESYPWTKRTFKNLLSLSGSNHTVQIMSGEQWLTIQGR